MPSHGGNTRASGEFVAWLGRLLIALVAGKDLRVRQAISCAAARARAGRGLDMKTRWHVERDLSANPRVE
jgi:hypothetical protein